MSEDSLKPAITVLVKLGSIAVHADELTSPSGHAFDRATLIQLLRDKEIVEWLEQMTEMGFLPVKR